MRLICLLATLLNVLSCQNNQKKDIDQFISKSVDSTKNCISKKESILSDNSHECIIYTDISCNGLKFDFPEKEINDSVIFAKNFDPSSVQQRVDFIVQSKILHTITTQTIREIIHNNLHIDHLHKILLIDQISWFQGKKGGAYYLSMQYGIYNDMEALYSTGGELLWFKFYSKEKKEQFEYQRLNEVLKENGIKGSITENLRSTDSRNQIVIFP